MTCNNESNCSNRGLFWVLFITSS